jgi:tRNA(Ile)-lysidine synthase
MTGTAKFPDPGALAHLSQRLDPNSSAPIAVGFSGGGDSLALLVLALSLERPVVALTVDHGLNPDSRQWTAQARAAALQLGASWRGLYWVGPKPSTGLPAAARLARHRLLAEAAREEGARIILLGHTSDDLAEAHLMRRTDTPLLALPRVWSPSPVWPEGRGLALLRPLLGASRHGLRQFLTARGLSWLEDPANQDLKYARARARKALDGQDDDLQAPEQAAPPALSTRAAQVRFDLAGRAALDRTLFEGTSHSLAQRLLGALILSVSGAERPARGVELARLLARLAAPGDFSATLCGARVSARGQAVSLVRQAPDPRSPRIPAFGVFDGRFECAAPLHFLSGYAAGLGPEDHRRLRRIPAEARPTLPVWLDADGRPHLPAPIGICAVSVRALAPDRFAFACGQIAHEGQLASQS